MLHLSEKTRPCLPRTAAYRSLFLHWRRPSKRPRGSDESRGRCCVSKKPLTQAFLPQNRPNFRVIARPQRGRGNLKVEGMGIPWRSTGARSKRESLSQKHGIRRFISLSLSLFQGFVSFRATIFRFGMTNRFVKDCRVGRKKCALLAMTESVGLIENTERKIQSSDSVKPLLYLLPDFDGSGLF